jgi:DNA-directed RNA polymerase subunit RPC12/RpoP
MDKYAGTILRYHTGHRPGRGLYLCIFCGMKLILDDNKDRLPPCPRCHRTRFNRIDRF